MSQTNSPTPNIAPPPPKEVGKFGWIHLLIRTVAVFLLTGILSYLQATKQINYEMAEAQLIVPAAVGLLLAILNIRYLVKISLLIMPIWFATGLAIAFAGLIIVGLLDLQLEQRMYWWLDILVQYLPAAIAGHWLYSGYSRMSKSSSFWIYVSVVLLSVLAAVLMMAETLDIFILQTLYLGFVCSLLSMLHLGRYSVNKK